MADSLEPGTYTIQQLLDHFDFDVDRKAAVSYESSGDHVDYRRVKIGGLGFDSPEDKLMVVSGSSLELTLDGEVVNSVDVK
jgi:hypothetical protein